MKNPSQSVSELYKQYTLSQTQRTLQAQSIHQLEQQNQQILNINDQLRISLDQHRKTQSSLKEQIHTLNEDLKREHLRSEVMIEGCEKIKEATDDWENKFNQRDNQVHNLEDRIELIQQERDQQVQDLEDEIKSISEEKDQQIRDLKKRIKSLQAQGAQKVHALEAKIKSMQKSDREEIRSLAYHVQKKEESEMALSQRFSKLKRIRRRYKKQAKMMKKKISQMEASFMNQSQYLKEVQTQMQHYQAQANQPTLFKKAVKYVTNVWDSKLLKF